METPIRTFKADDIVEFRPYEDCTKLSTSGPGKVIEVLEDNFYKVTFGDYEYKNQSAWRNTGKVHWAQLFPFTPKSN